MLLAICSSEWDPWLAVLKLVRGVEAADALLGVLALLLAALDGPPKVKAGLLAASDALYVGRGDLCVLRGGRGFGELAAACSDCNAGMSSGSSATSTGFGMHWLSLWLQPDKWPCNRLYLVPWCRS